MKKTIAILLAVLLVAGTAFAVTPGHRQSPGVGIKLNNQQGGYSDDA